MLKLRLATQSEIDWINERYDEVAFFHSKFDGQAIAIAEWDGQKAGLGRLVALDESHSELGGIYVFHTFRGKGIARELVKFLIQHAKPSQTVYCIPFAHLISFYEQFGFTACPDLKQVPEKLVEKFLWYQQIDTHPTALLQRSF